MTAAGPSASDLADQLAQCRADWLPRYFAAGKLRGGVFEVGGADGAAGRSFPIPLRDHPCLVDFGGDSHSRLLDLSMAISVRNENYRLIDVDKNGLIDVGKNGDRPDWPHIEPFVINNIAIGHEADEAPITCGVAVVITMDQVPNLTQSEKMEAAGAITSFKNGRRRSIRVDVLRDYINRIEAKQAQEDGHRSAPSPGPPSPARVSRHVGPRWPLRPSRSHRPSLPGASLPGASLSRHHRSPGCAGSTRGGRHAVELNSMTASSARPNHGQMPRLCTGGLSPKTANTNPLPSTTSGKQE